MPDENEEKKSKKKKPEISAEVSVGITNEQPVVYSSGENLINYMEAASSAEVENTIGAFEDSCIFQAISKDDEGDLTVIEIPFTMQRPEISYNETVSYQYVYNFQDLFDINIQRDKRTDVETICSNMKDFIKENIYSNPESVQIAIATLQTMSYLYYDEGTNNILGASGFTRKDLGNTSEEILEKIYNTSEGDMLEGFVCSTISDFTMRLLHECNIEAAMFCGGNSGSDHTTLLYKQSDGKYVYVDNHKFSMVEASNIKDAVKALHRNNISPGDFGYIMLIDENSSYQEFDLENETVWGYELDKRDYNKAIAELPVIENGSSIKADYNMSLTGGHEINLTGTNVKYKDENSFLQHKLSIGVKNNSFSLADEGLNPGTYKFNSIGVKYETGSLKKNDNDDITYVKTKSILSTTNIEYPVSTKITHNEFSSTYHDYDEESLAEAQRTMDESFFNQLQNLPEEYIGEIYEDYFRLVLEDGYEDNFGMERHCTEQFRNIMLFNRTELGLNTKINDNFSATSQLSSTLGLNARPFDGIVFCGDLRLTAEESINYNRQVGNSEIKADVNGGIVADLSIKTGVLKPGIGLGVKGNADLSVMTHLTDNISAGANIAGYAVATPVSSDYGASAGVSIAYNKDNVSIFGNLNAGCDKQQLYVGRFDEMTENSLLLNALIGFRINNNTFQAGYTTKKDALNPTKNKNIFTLGVNFNF